MIQAVKSHFKSKNIKKSIVKGIKEFENYNEEDCMLLYLDKLKSIWRYDEEIYDCHLGVGIQLCFSKLFNFKFEF